MAKKICICEGIYALVVAVMCLFHLTMGRPQIPQIAKALMIVFSSIGLFILFISLKKKNISLQQCLLTVVPVLSINLLMSNI